MSDPENEALWLLLENTERARLRSLAYMTAALDTESRELDRMLDELRLLEAENTALRERCARCHCDNQ